MSGNNIILDTNIILYLLSGDDTLLPLLKDKKLYISFVSQIETLGYKGISEQEISKVKLFLNECVIIDINPVIKDITINLRRNYSIKLPDCIIAASSLYLNAPLITADMEFNKVSELDLILYQ